MPDIGGLIRELREAARGAGTPPADSAQMTGTAPGAAETDPSAGIRTPGRDRRPPAAYRAAFEAAPPEQQAALLAEVGLSQV